MLPAAYSVRGSFCVAAGGWHKNGGRKLDRRTTMRSP